MTAFRFMTLCLLLGTFVKTSAAQYEVDGQIEQTIYKMDGAVSTERKARFTVFAKDCSWLIQTTNLDGNGEPTGVNETASTNGGVIYSVFVPIYNDAQMAGHFFGGGARNGGASIWSDANIYSNNVPVGEGYDYFICHLWLMFASGCYFENPATNWLTPAYDLNASVAVNPNLKRQAKWELVNGPGSLPSNVVYLDEHFNPFTNATYFSTGVTNAGKLEIPSGFVFEERVISGHDFATGSSISGVPDPNYRVRKRAVATVTAVRPYCSRAEFVPTAKGNTQVMDERLAQVPNSNPRMHYQFQNGFRWVSVEQAKKLVAASTPPKNPPPKAIVAVILLVPGVVVLFLWFLNRSKGQTVIHPNDG